MPNPNTEVSLTNTFRTKQQLLLCAAGAEQAAQHGEEQPWDPSCRASKLPSLLEQYLVSHWDGPDNHDASFSQ